MQSVPLQSNSTQRQTDIQLAESYIYEELARVNQCRLAQNQPIKPQSVVWLTDAPLFTKPGITSDVWIETPADSPFRSQSSPPSQERKSWLKTLPLEGRSQSIDNYQLSVVDIPPTVQEFCTPAPGGKETCLITPYLIQQLWLPTAFFVSSLVSVAVICVFGLKYFISLKKIWKLKIIGEDEQIRFLKHQQSLAIGDDIECPGSEVRGYLKREKNRIFLEPISETLPIYYQGREITKLQ